MMEKRPRFLYKMTLGLVVLACVFQPLYSIAEDHPASEPVSINAPVKALADPDRVSLDLKGMDVVEVIKMLSAQGNLNIILGNDVKGRVTIFLKNVKLMDAFELILVASDLAYDKRGEIIYVMSQAEYENTYGERFSDKKKAKIFQLKFAQVVEVSKALNQMKSKIGKIITDDASNTIVIIDSPEFIAQMEGAIKDLDSLTVTKVFSLTYAKVTDLKTKIFESLTPGVGTLQIDERTNKATVTDLERKVGQIQNMITAFDDKLQQVFIESKIIQITLDDQYKLGVDWSSFLNKLHKVSNIQNAFSLAPRDTLSPGTQIAIGSGNSSSDYNIMVQALKSVGDTNLLSSPRITVLNNQEAKILVGKTQPYAMNTITQGTATTTTATNLQFIDIGVKLYVTPTVNRDGFITMRIRPEVSSATEVYTYGNPPTTVPIVETTQAETTVTVKDGTTIIIAGLIKDERKSTVDKVPILGDIPFIKNAFRKTSKEITKQELVVFLTPHIVTGENDYLESPQSPPIGEQKFTVPEDQVFERRSRVKLEPDVFKDRLTRKTDTKGLQGVSPEVKAGSEPAVFAASPEEYYSALKEKILKNILSVQEKDPAPLKGLVKIRFSLTSKGGLAHPPEILESSNYALNILVLDAVIESDPFPVSPVLKSAETQFVVDFAFE